MKFVDLFAGLGGFHLALKELGHECVFACEIDETLRTLYEKNFGLRPAGDIRRIEPINIPAHDILCAGFPCQPFSKAGSQPGLDHPSLGDLYKQIMRIIKVHWPMYLILENVPNLERHSNGRTWRTIEDLLTRAGYDVRLKRLSPHQFGVPQIRERIFIVAGLSPLGSFEWPEPTHEEVSIFQSLDRYPSEARELPQEVTEIIQLWQDFLNQIPKNQAIPHPIWSTEFGATYPFEETTPSQIPFESLRKYKGSHGVALRNCRTKKEMLRLLPSYARVNQKFFPSWKRDFIRKNRDFYRKYRVWIDSWKEKIAAYPSSYQKLEWNCHEEDPRTEVRVLSRYILQLRPSGLRVKRPTTAPSLVAMTATQVPIVPWENRFMTPRECLRLQSMDLLRHLPGTRTKVYWAIGNAVNVRVAKLVAQALLGESEASNGRMDRVLLGHIG